MSVKNLNVKASITLSLLFFLNISCDNEPVDYFPIQISKKLIKWVETKYLNLSNGTSELTDTFIVKNDKIAKNISIQSGKNVDKHEFI